MSAEPVTYWDYINVEDLLGLQGGIDDREDDLCNEEVLFITVHQVYELWFKLILRELREARNLFTAENVAEQELSGAVARLKRCVTILRVCVKHFEVVETLSTREYLAFRDKLMPASGFQSAQLRQIEILFGLDENERIPLQEDGDYKKVLGMVRPGDKAGSPALKRVEEQLKDRPTLKEAIEAWLYRTPIDGCRPGDEQAGERLDRFAEGYLAAHSKQVDVACERALELARSMGFEPDDLRKRYEGERQAIRDFLSSDGEEQSDRRRRARLALFFIETYRELPLLAWPREVLDTLVELEQAFVVFRQRHARMVERVIGRRTGTGGTSGVDYLDATAQRYRIFRDLWEVRTHMIRASSAPKLNNEGFYEFRAES